MELSDDALLGFAIALGIGLLIGIDRERPKGDGPTRSAGRHPHLHPRGPGRAPSPARSTATP